jgi:hypothetical protein
MKKITIITILLISIFTSSVIAQIPNSGFETWTGNEPSGWDNLNSLTSAIFIYTCTKGTPGNPGNSYIKLTTKSVPLVGVVPGIALSGKLNKTTFEPTSGFAYSQRPTALTGNWQYMAASATDQGFIAIAFTKWNASNNTRDTLSTTYYQLPGMVMSWEVFTIPITFNSASNPDTCLIVVSASDVSAPVANSYLYLDNLNFSFVSDVKNIKGTALKTYPNPVAEQITVEMPDNKNSMPFTYKIINSIGQIVQADIQLNYHTINTSALHTGFYQLIIENNGNQYFSKFIKK